MCISVCTHAYDMSIGTHMPWCAHGGWRTPFGSLFSLPPYFRGRILLADFFAPEFPTGASRQFWDHKIESCPAFTWSQDQTQAVKLHVKEFSL